MAQDFNESWIFDPSFATNLSIAGRVSRLNDDKEANEDKLQAIQFYPAYNVAMDLLIYVLPVIIVLGTVGNILSFIVMMQREMRKSSTCFYLAILAIADTIILYVSGLKTWIRAWSGFEMLHVSGLVCKLLYFLIHSCLHFSAWLIVAVTIERFVAVWFPLKAPSFCSLLRAKVITTFIAGIIASVNIHIFWTAELVNAPNSLNPDKVQCSAYTYKDIVCAVFPWVNLTVYSFLPFTVLLIFNILIIVSLVNHRKAIMGAMTRDDQIQRYNHRKLAITLLAISFIWIFTTIPSTLYGVTAQRSTSIEDDATGMLIKVVFYLLMYFNHSVNFLLYCITGQRFRKELVRLVCRAQNRQPRAKLVFKTSGSGSGQSGSGQDSTHPLMNNLYMDTVNSDKNS